MKVLICVPRLDLPFKFPKSKPPSKTIKDYTRVKLPEIRTYWNRFLLNLEASHQENNDDVHILELPLSNFKPHMVDEIKPDLVYVPHKQQTQFPVQCKVLYYMQMAIPYLFQMDPLGWGPNASVHPIQPVQYGHHPNFSTLQKRHLENGFTKFNVCKKLYSGDPGFVLFTCQLPRDEAVVFHGNGLQVIDALRMTVEYCQTNNKSLVIRGHPISKQKMKPFIHAYPPEKGYTWSFEENINSLIAKCSMLVTLGSGTGIDAILHGKPVVIFGRADYESVVNRVIDIEHYSRVFDNASANIEDYKHFIEKYHDVHHDCREKINLQRLSIVTINGQKYDRALLDMADSLVEGHSDGGISKSELQM